MSDLKTPPTPSAGAPASPGSLEELRRTIIDIDAHLVDLLNQRASVSLAVGELKRTGGQSEVFRPGREADLLKKLEAMSGGPLPKEHLRAIYREILSSSRYLQRPQRVAFLGPEGTFSHIAGRELLGSLAEFQPKLSFGDVFTAVSDETCDIGIVPLENSLQGSIGQGFDLFLRHPELHIRAETSCRIRHSLLSREKELSSIQRVFSHPQPLAQCGLWLKSHLPRAALLPLESTAAAARHVLEQENAAAIAHVSLAAGLGLHVLAQDIEDSPGNRTRFVVIGRTPADRPGTDKSSILFAVPDKPGRLFAMLQIFASNNINLRKLESRPMPSEPGNYVFFADLECDVFAEEHAAALAAAQEQCLFLRVLGSYPSNI